MKSLLIIVFFLCILKLSALSPAYLGVYLEDIPQDEKRSLKLNEGVKIENIVSDSPAEKVGLKANDIILRINGRPVNDSRQLVEMIKQHRPGDTINVTYLSNNNRFSVDVTLAKRENALFPSVSLLHTRTKHLGLKVQNLTTQLKDFFGVQYGVMVAEVIPHSPADNSGIKAGDILIRISGEQIDSSADLRAVVRDKAAGTSVSIQVYRDGIIENFDVEIEEPESLISFDLDGQIIILDKEDVIDLGKYYDWFESMINDSTKIELRKRLERLQEELNQIKKKLQN